jgi:hypothetical protein
MKQIISSKNLLFYDRPMAWFEAYTICCTIAAALLISDAVL